MVRIYIATVLESKLLTAPGEPEKRHLKIKLGEGMKHTAGDYVAVQPVNHDETVKAVMRRYDLEMDTQVLWNNGTSGRSVGKQYLSVYTLLREMVELNHPATEKIPGESERDVLEKMIASKAFRERRPSALHLLMAFPTATLSFANCIAMLPPLHVRRYSISSSPLGKDGAGTCTLTYSVVNVKRTKPPGGNFGILGTASTYLASLHANDRLWISVRPSHPSFHPPTDPTTTPVILVCAGAGLAPFRGFVEERAAIAKAMATVRELRDWEKTDGVVELRYAYSGAPERSGGYWYVQDLLWEHREMVMELIAQGTGKMYMCGGAKVLEGVTKCVVRAYAEEMGRR
ncbi:hypothetical protein BX600DRAFT_515104 [Xylariales sp. PMI_506]|nr:hypothetical protein BX600DRAFT_515104 [Xylariales sp. PMI_506]